MVTNTDLSLRSALDSNQRDREQMCRAVLALDARYTEVRPRHPLGGPDGGRDIEAVLDGDRIAYGAVGFANGANDSSEQKARIRGKFRDDLHSALKAKPGLKVFVFFTNLHFTMGEQDAMKEEARKAGIEHCDILDRERLRIELDSPAGFFIRFQYLRIALSEAEQASFLSRYGDRLQDMVSTGFGRVEKTLNRLLFLQESTGILDRVDISIGLNRSYSADEIAHFRAYCMIALRGITHNILQIIAATADKSNRFSRDRADLTTQLPGIRHGISTGSWENHVEPSSHEDAGDKTADELEDEKWTPAGSGGGGGISSNSVSDIFVSYSHDDVLFRFRPRLQLRDLDDCMFMPILNLSLAEKVSSFDVHANGYLLLSIGPAEFTIDRSAVDFKLPGEFTPEELADPWVRIRPASGSSAFQLRFSERTPRRMFGHEEISERQSPEPGTPTGADGGTSQ